MNTKTLLLLPVLLVAAGACYGQGARPVATVGNDSPATALTREMSNRLQLNEGQYIKLYSLNRIRLARQQEIERATAKDATDRTAQLAELESQFEQECARILTPSQLSQLQQDQGSSMAGNG